MDLHAIEARAAARQELTSWAAALQVLVDHQHAKGRRSTACCCGRSWPCAVREQALDEVAGPLPPLPRFEAER